MAQRIVSLVPGATELICELGLRGRIVGRSAWCDHPASVLRLPALTDPGVPAQHLKTSAARPAQAIVQQYLANSSVLVERLIELQPDFIVTKFNAAAEGYNLDELKRALNSLIISRPQILTFSATTLAEVHTEIQKIADTFGVGQKGKALVARHRKRFDQITDKARTAARPRVLCLSHLEPLQAAGYWVPTLIEAAGGTPLVSQVGQGPSLLTWEQIAALDPDVLILAIEGLSASEHRVALDELSRLDSFRRLRAFKAQRVRSVDGNQLLNRPGPRLLESVDALAEMLHPELFGIRHLGSSWTELS